MEFTKKEQRILKYIEKGRTRYVYLPVFLPIVISIVLAIKRVWKEADVWSFLFIIYFSMSLFLAYTYYCCAKIIQKYQKRLKELEGRT